MQKRGISPLIATILIIGFTIVLAAMVMQWGTTLLKGIQEQTGKQAELKIACTGISNLEIVPLSPSEIRLNNNNDIALEGFIFRSYIGDDIITTDIPIGIDKLGSRKFTIITDYSKGIPNKVGVFPKIRTSEGKIAICDSEITKDITTVPTKSGLDLTWASQLQLTQLRNVYKNGIVQDASTFNVNQFVVNLIQKTQTPVPGDGSSVSTLTGTLNVIDSASGNIVIPDTTFSAIINGDRLALSIIYRDTTSGTLTNYALAGSLVDTNADTQIDTSEGAIAIILKAETIGAAATLQALGFENVYAEYSGVAS